MSSPHKIVCSEDFWTWVKGEWESGGARGLSEAIKEFAIPVEVDDSIKGWECRLVDPDGKEYRRLIKRDGEDVVYSLDTSIIDLGAEA